MSLSDAFIDRYNAIVGAVIAILSYVLGKHWFLFVAFLALNLVDWFTGWMKSRIAKKESSYKGMIGVLKKFGYWIIIGVSFGMSAAFIDIGKVIGVDLKVTTLLGWFVLASLLINEIRSIFENLVECGYNIPYILIKGLDVANKLMESESGITEEPETNNEEKKE